MNIKCYSKRPFPPYRFIPGQNPHPTESPQGHSYQRKEETVEPLESHNWQKNQTYLYAVDLYNHGFWWEAHEALESLWQKIPKDDVRALFLQGLIKISAALLKRYLKQERGFLILSKNGMDLLKKVSQKSPVFMGVDVLDYLQQLQRYFYTSTATQKHGCNTGEKYPFLFLSN